MEEKEAYLAKASVRIKADYTVEMLGRRDVQPLLEQAVALLGLVERRIG